AHALTEQQVHMFRIDERQRDTEKCRQRKQDVTGQSAMCRVDADLAQNLESFAHDVREVLENFRKVAASLALDEHRGGKKPHVQMWNSVSQILQRIFHRKTEVLLVECFPELGSNRLVHLIGDHLQAGSERVTSLQCARDQVERLGK